MTRTVATLVTLVVIAGSSAAFAVSEKLKVERAPIGAARFEPPSRRFSPICDCPTSSMQLSYVFRRGDTVDVTVVDSAGRTVRTLVEGERLSRGRHTFEWDGRSDAGALMPDGAYRMRIRFLEERRSILAPIAFQLDTQPPRLRTRVAPTVISPDGDGRNDAAVIRYRANEKGTVELSVDGAVLVHKRAGEPRTTHVLRWGGRVPAQGTTDGTADQRGRVPARPGDHELVLSVRDIAGNVARARFTVRIRFIELTEPAYSAPAGGQLEFTVDTDAASFQWSLISGRAGRPGRTVLSAHDVSGRTVSTPIAASVTPGLYTLRVEANGHRSRAPVHVTGGPG